MIPSFPCSILQILDAKILFQVLLSILLFNNPPRTFAANGEPLSLFTIFLLICCRFL
uniref:Uncharacterized protein n=1 Tax=Arundo donax TaxID=35708 RepID=A0A0A8YYB2_ARUDO